MSNSNDFVIENGVLKEYKGKDADIVIPDSVTSIGENVFKDCRSLKSVTIPGSVTRIGIHAFENCYSLQAVYIDNIAAWCGISFESHDSTPVYYAHKLYINGIPAADIVLPDSVTNIGAETFSGCHNLKSITIPDSVTSIGDYSFYDCCSLTAVTIPDSVESLGDGAFRSCRSLTAITIPGSVTSIGSGTFCSCRSLTAVTIPDSITSIGEDAFVFCSSLKSITIPDSVTNIGNNAFKGPIYFKGKTFDRLPEWCKPENVILGFIINYEKEGASDDVIKSYTDYIGANKYKLGFAFFLENKALFKLALEQEIFTAEDVEALLTLLPDNEKAEERALLIEYANTLNLQSDPFEIMDRMFEDGYIPIAEIIKEWQFSENADGTVTLNKYIGDKTKVICPVKISDKPVTSIGRSAFYNCGSLESITIPDGVTSIGDYAFYGCPGLKSITIPDGVTSIGDYVFYYCSSLESIAIPDSVTCIGKGAFAICRSLKSVTIPAGVTSIGDLAFNRCGSLTSITIPDSVTSIGKYAFDGCSALPDEIKQKIEKIQNG